MGLYIPDVKLPPDKKYKWDLVLHISYDGTVRSPWGDLITDEKAIELPPHGRLGDLDEMAVDESEAYMSAQLKLGDDVLTKAINEAVHAKIIRLIADTPTIIPTSGGADG